MAASKSKKEEVDKIARGKKCTACLLQRTFCSDSTDGNEAKKSQFDLATPKKAQKERADDELKQSNKHVNVDPELVEAAHKVESSVKEWKGNVAQDLLQMLDQQSELSNKQKTRQSSIGSLLRDFDRSNQPQSPGKPNNKRQTTNRDSAPDAFQSKKEGMDKGPRGMDSEPQEMEIKPWRTKIPKEPQKRSTLDEGNVFGRFTKSAQTESNQALDAFQSKKGEMDRGPYRMDLKPRGVDSILKSIERGPQRIERRPRRMDMPKDLPQKSILDEGNALGIFTKSAQTESNQELTLFDKLEKKQLSALLKLPPSNAFEEEIEWTKQGKMWRYPVDNEEGMEEEAEVGFHEHVFLDKHLHGFPDKGPVRYFMELVTVGLSKNPYLSVQQKVEHINWFRDYFSDKLEDIEKSTLIQPQTEAPDIPH